MKIKFSRGFEKDYRKAPKKIKQNFEFRLEVFLSNKNAIILHNHLLSGKYEGFKSINITGDWRAIYREENDNLVVFTCLGTHSQLYG